MAENDTVWGLNRMKQWSDEGFGIMWVGIWAMCWGSQGYSGKGHVQMQQVVQGPVDIKTQGKQPILG